jgi:hypothetical protein
LDIKVVITIKVINIRNINYQVRAFFFKNPFTGPVVAQRVGRGIPLTFHELGTRRG